MPEEMQDQRQRAQDESDERDRPEERETIEPMPVDEIEHALEALRGREERRTGMSGAGNLEPNRINNRFGGFMPNSSPRRRAGHLNQDERHRYDKRKDDELPEGSFKLKAEKNSNNKSIEKRRKEKRKMKKGRKKSSVYSEMPMQTLQMGVGMARRMEMGADVDTSWFINNNGNTTAR